MDDKRWSVADGVERTAYSLQLLFPHVSRWINDARLFEPSQPKRARIAVPAGRSIRRGVVTAGRQRVVDAQRRAQLHDLTLGHSHQGRLDLQSGRSLDTGARGQVCHGLERGNVLRTAVGI